MKRSKSQIIAVTGGIGSGKSFLGNVAERNGFIVIDTDGLSREAVKSKKVTSKLKRTFGKDIYIEAGLNRMKLSSIVFNDKTKLELLNLIMFPAVDRLLKKELKKHKKEKTVFVQIPLLFECGSRIKFDKVWLILSDEKIRIERAAKRDHLNEEEVIKRIRSQINYNEKAELAHTVLYNNGTQEEFAESIKELLKTL